MERYGKTIAICKRFGGHSTYDVVKTPKVGRPARPDDGEMTAIFSLSGKDGVS